MPNLGDCQLITLNVHSVELFSQDFGQSGGHTLTVTAGDGSSLHLELLLVQRCFQSSDNLRLLCGFGYLGCAVVHLALLVSLFGQVGTE